MDNITAGLNIKGKGVEIPNCGRNDIPLFLKNRGCNTGVEIGVYKGDYTRLLLDAGLKVYGVDPWVAYEEWQTMEHSNHSPRQDRQDELYGIAQDRTKKYPLCTLVRKTSMDALKDFKDGSLDFVYIDGHHGFKYVTEDIWEWSKKIRKGGIICGHDYGINEVPNDPYTLHVKYVVDAYTAALNINNWWILGSKDAVEGETRDKWRSWLWII